jgi:hypothetical protein
LEWDGGEKFYNYEEWLEYLIAHFFNRWGYTLSGCVRWSGEDTDDVGTLAVEDNVVTALHGEILRIEDLGPAEQDEDVSPYSNLSVVEQIETLDRLMKEQKSLVDQRNEMDEQIDDMQEDINELMDNLESVYDRLRVFFGRSE